MGGWVRGLAWVVRALLGRGFWWVGFVGVCGLVVEMGTRDEVEGLCAMVSGRVNGSGESWFLDARSCCRGRVSG